MQKIKSNQAEYFDALAETYETWATPLLTKLRARFIKRFIGTVVLDVGVGRGTLLKAYTQNTTFVTGCDISPRMLALAQALNLQAKLFVSSAELLEFPANTFETIILSEVVYYLTDLSGFLQKAIGWLKPQGKMIVIFGNQKYNVFYPLAGKLGLRLPDTLGEQTISIEIIKKQVERSDFLVKFDCFGGLPCFGWSSFFWAVPVFPLQAVVVTKLSPK